MRLAYLRIRAALLWTLSALHFGLFGLFMVLIRPLSTPRKLDPLLRFFFRNIRIIAGARTVFHHAPGFDPERTCLIVCNHVNLFDPFVTYEGVPQYSRALELESHFNIPFYGWFMKLYGNIPVADDRNRASMMKTFRMVKQYIEDKTSVVVMAEGKRTLDGRVGEFEDGVFFMAQKFKVPITPISLVGSFEFNNKLSLMLYPQTIHIYLHDMIETKDLTKADVPALRDKVRAVIAKPIDEFYAARNEAADGEPPHSRG